MMESIRATQNEKQKANSSTREQSRESEIYQQRILKCERNVDDDVESDLKAFVLDQRR